MNRIVRRRLAKLLGDSVANSTTGHRIDRRLKVSSAALAHICVLSAVLLLSSDLRAADSPAGPRVTGETSVASAKTSPAVLTKLTPGIRDTYPRPFRKAVPTSIEDLKAIEAHVEYVRDRVSPAVVAVEVGGSTGSAVVISADGTVLSAAHVCGEPGRDVEFTFPDGKTAKGKTLGMNHEIDSGLMKITDPGPWPHVPVGDLKEATLGGWVLALGHPGGFDPERPVVLRLGRIIRLATGVLQTDCTLIGGDSGGPLFDMSGRVIGIHSRISESTAENFHVPITTFYDTWDRLAQGDEWGNARMLARYNLGLTGVDDPEGCRLERIRENSPGARAGVQTGDIVMKVNDQTVKGYESFLQHVSRARSAEVTLQIKRDDMEISVRVPREAVGGFGRGRGGRRGRAP